MTHIIKEDSEDDVSEIESQLNESDDDDDLNENNFPGLINHFFTNDEGENIAQILTDMKKSLDTHNKLIYKLLSASAESKKK